MRALSPTNTGASPISSIRGCGSAATKAGQSTRTSTSPRFPSRSAPAARSTGLRRARRPHSASGDRRSARGSRLHRGRRAERGVDAAPRTLRERAHRPRTQADYRSACRSSDASATMPAPSPPRAGSNRNWRISTGENRRSSHSAGRGTGRLGAVAAKAGQGRRSFSARRRNRFHRAHHRRMADAAARAARRSGEPPRGERRHRGGLRRALGARRLHAAFRGHAPARDRAARAENQLRPDQGFRADLDRRHESVRAGLQPERAWRRA